MPGRFPPGASVYPMRSRVRLLSSFLTILALAALAACDSVSGPNTPDSPSVAPSPLPPPAVTVVGTSPPPPGQGTAAVSPEPTPSAAPAEGAYGPRDFPPDVNPLTGLKVDSPALLERRPVAIKVSNAPRSGRPQWGLSLADLVYEHIAEGGNSRFTAIYLGNEVEQVGPVRSARLIDLELPAMYRAVFAYSGGSAGVRSRLINADFVARAYSEGSAGTGPWIYRTGSGGVNSLMANTAALTQLSIERGVPGGRQELDGMRFDPAPPSGGEPAITVAVRYSRETFCEWRFDPGAGLYQRWAETDDHSLAVLTEAATGQPITAANVVVVFAPTFLTDILEDDSGFDPSSGTGGHYSAEIQLWGSGEAVVFRDGQAYPVTWVRFEREGVLGLVLAGDTLLPLKPGNTWVQLVGFNATESSENGAWKFQHKEP